MPNPQFNYFLDKLDISISTAKSLSREYMVSFTSCLIRMIHVTREPLIMILWKMGNIKQDNESPYRVPQLRVDWMVTNYDSIRISRGSEIQENSGPYTCWTQQKPFEGYEKIELGNIDSLALGEHVPFNFGGVMKVLSLFHLRG